MEPPQSAQNGSATPKNPLMPKLGRLAPTNAIYAPSISLSTAPQQQPQFKSRFLAKHQRERSPLSPDRSISAAKVPGPPRLPTLVTRDGLTTVRENEESSPKPVAKNDRLSSQIQSFISRTDHVANEWKRLGEQRSSRAFSVARDDYDIDLRSAAYTAPMRNMRASSVAPGYPDPRARFLSPERQPRRPSRDMYSPLREDFSFKNTPSVTASVASRARLPQLVVPGVGGYTSQAGAARRFLTLEDECNWILSGREPLPDDLNGLGHPDSDGEDNTLDDISGDEV